MSGGAGLALTGMGMVLGFIGKNKQAQATKELAEENARLIEWEGRINYEQAKREVASLIGAQSSIYAKGGVLTTEGTPVEVMSETALAGERDALYTLYASQIRANIVHRGGVAQSVAIRYGAIADLLGAGGSMMMMGS